MERGDDQRMRKKQLVCKTFGNTPLVGFSIQGLVIDSSEDGFTLLMLDGKDLSGGKPRPLELTLTVPTKSYPTQLGEVVSLKLACHVSGVSIAPTDDEEEDDVPK